MNQNIITTKRYFINYENSRAILLRRCFIFASSKFNKIVNKATANFFEPDENNGGGKIKTLSHNICKSLRNISNFLQFTKSYIEQNEKTQILKWVESFLSLIERLSEFRLSLRKNYFEILLCCFKNLLKNVMRHFGQSGALINIDLIKRLPKYVRMELSVNGGVL